MAAQPAEIIPVRQTGCPLCQRPSAVYSEPCEACRKAATAAIARDRVRTVSLRRKYAHLFRPAEEAPCSDST